MAEVSRAFTFWALALQQQASSKRRPLPGGSLSGQREALQQGPCGQHEAVRARERLVAALPVRLSGHGPAGSWKLHARLLANPAREPIHDFAEFAPIPRLVVDRESEEGRHMAYRFEGASPAGGDKEEALRWGHAP